MPTLSPAAQQLFEIVMTGSSRAASAFMLAQIDAGSTPTALVTDVLAPVQIEMGELWHRNLRTIADEHAATSAIEYALATLAVTAPPVPADQGTLAVVCGQGDWHTMPARMAAELWRWSGWDVTFLGGSVPPEDLAAWLTKARPDALAISCAVTVFVPGVLALSDAAATAGVTCVVGGRGLGADGRHARALGLRWAGSPGDLAAALASEPPSVDTADLGRRRLAADELEATMDDTVDAAIRATAEALPALRSYSKEQLDRTRQDYESLLSHLAVAVLCADDTVFVDLLSWMHTSVLNREIPPTVLPIGLAVLADVLPPGSHEARRLCEDALRGAWYSSGLGVLRPTD